jgi:hypothetical protein
MMDRRVVESPRYSDWVGEALSPGTAQKVLEGTTWFPDGSGRLHVEGLTEVQMQEILEFARRAGIAVEWRPPAVSLDEFCDDPERVLDWLQAHDDPVEICDGEHRFRLVAV